METLKNEVQMSEEPTSESEVVDAVNVKDQVPGDAGVARRFLTEHCTDVDRNHLVVQSRDGRGPGGAFHHYSIWWPDSQGGAGSIVDLPFQKGGLQEVGPNGITNEVLLAIVKDRLECFQSGLFACEQNESALEFVAAALEALKDRTRERLSRGVEGKQEA